MAFAGACDDASVGDALTTSVEEAEAPSPGPSSADPAPGEAERLTVEVLEVRPHDREAFTQGLELADGALLESTGLYGSSSIRRVDPVTGDVVDESPLPDSFFGEGLTRVGDRVIQLTWREGAAFEWSVDGLDPLGRLPLEREGWGLCHDDQRDRLVHSDGTATLTFRAPATFEPTGGVEVTRADGSPVERLNELECTSEGVWANIWQTDEIVRIDPDSGSVTASVDASSLDPGWSGADVLNGIAQVDEERFLVTGKLWANLYLVRFVPA